MSSVIQVAEQDMHISFLDCICSTSVLLET